LRIAVIHARRQLTALTSLDMPLQNGIGLREAGLQAQQFPASFFAELLFAADGFAAPIPMFQSILAIVQELLVVVTEKNFESQVVMHGALSFVEVTLQAVGQCG
jgi:hypothetical protein